MYYGPVIIMGTGISLQGYKSTDPMLGILLNIPLAFVNIIGTVLVLLFIEKKGRRSLMLKGLPFIVFSHILIAFSMYLSKFTESEHMQSTGHILAMIGLITYLLSFSGSMSSSVWSVNTEIYPIHLIEQANSLSTASNWLANFIISSLFLSFMSSDTGKITAFIILAFFSCLAYAFVHAYLPETKGKSIPENVNNVMTKRGRREWKNPA